MLLKAISLLTPVIVFLPQKILGQSLKMRIQINKQKKLVLSGNYLRPVLKQSNTGGHNLTGSENETGKLKYLI
jgi:hypothetical protein